MNTVCKVAMAVVGVTLAISLATPAAADPNPNCYSQLPWAVCNEPWNNYMPGSWDFNPEPGQWGPGGYRYCDASEGCGR